MLHSAGALDGEHRQRLSHTRTFQWHVMPDSSGLPEYSTWIDWSEAILSESHRSPWSLASSSGEEATRIWQAALH